MSLMKRGGVYWTYFYIEGTRHQMSTGTGNRRLAEDIAKKLRDQENLKRFQVVNYTPQMTFGELSAHFLAKAKVRAHHPERLEFLLGFFADMPIGRIDKGLVNKYREARHAHKTVSVATVNRDIEVLRRILYWAVDDEHLLPVNPIARISMERERRKRRPVLSVADELRLLAAASPHLRRIIIAALDTGMRRGEILAQQWEGVDFDRRLLCVSRSKTPQGESRELPLTSRLFQILVEGRGKSGPIFVFKEKAIHQIKSAWKAAIRRSGIAWHRFHDLRHTFNTRLLEAGVLQEVRKTLMGHSSGEDVHAIYTEPPRVYRRLQFLRGWSYEQSNEVFAGSPGTSGPASVGAARRARVSMGGDGVDREQDWVHNGELEELGTSSRA